MASKIRYSEIVIDALTRDLVKVCAKLGWMAAKEAYRNKSFTNRTFNLHDSYGSAVYLNGKLIEDSIRYVNRSRSKTVDRNAHSIGDARTGRDALHRFFKSTHRELNFNKISIVVAASMWYADYVERKGYEVLDTQLVRSVIMSNFEKEARPIFKKYGAESFMPKIRTMLGFDEVALE